MRRMLCLLLILILSCSSALAAGNFSATDARSARLAALECPKVTAFNAEYGDATSSGKLLRWDNPASMFRAIPPSRTSNSWTIS